jgi:sugar lactone lactonase YvrE
MSDTLPPNLDQGAYTETIVEYADNRRQRAVLGILLVILFLLLLGAAYSVYVLTPGKGAPTGKAALPKGITWVRSIYGWGNRPAEQLRTPTDVAIADDGTIWVVSGHDTISGYAPDGTAKRVIKPKNTASIETIAVGDDGNLYVADFGGQVLEFSPNGKFLDKWNVDQPQGVYVSGDKIAVSASKGIAVFTHNDSKIIVQAGGTRGWGKDQFDLPHGILMAPDGTIYVADTQNRRIKALSSKGRNLWMLGEAPDRSQPGVADVRSKDSSISASTFLLPAGLTLDGKGRIAVVDPFRFNVTFVDPKTHQIAREPGSNGKAGKKAVYGEMGEGDGFFANPTGIDYDKTRDWFAIADTLNNRVQIVRFPGTGGSAIAPLIGGFRWPMCIFCLPFILLLLAIILAAMRRRRARDLGPADAPAAAVAPK